MLERIKGWLGSEQKVVAPQELSEDEKIIRGMYTPQTLEHLRDLGHSDDELIYMGEGLQSVFAPGVEAFRRADQEQRERARDNLRKLENSQNIEKEPHG